MLLDCCAALAIIIMLQMLMIPKFIESLDSRDTLLGCIVLKTKFQAIKTNQSMKINIKEYKLNQKYDVNINHCELEFTASGTTSKARTCKGENANLTLRPGEGGIGYPWK